MGARWKQGTWWEKTNTAKGHHHGTGGPAHQCDPRAVVLRGVRATLAYSSVNTSTVVVPSFIPTSLPRKRNGFTFLKFLL